MMQSARILIIEDDKSVAESLKHALKADGYEVATAASAAQGLRRIGEEDYQVVVTDWNLRTPNETGIDIIKTCREIKPHLPVILMTGEHTAETAIEATKSGGYEYVVKSGQLIDDLLGLIEKAVATNLRMAETVEMGDGGFSKDAIIGQSRVMQEVFKQIGRVADTPVTVLIRGETGTGKELVARAIYQHSNRANQTFLEVNCAAIPDNLLESELFGNEAGAFTDAKVRRIGKFEQANHGTIFLDEIGDMSLNTQTKLLRVLQDRRFQRLGGRDTVEVDVRVIAATHRDLESAIKDKQFREDLYYRLNDAVIRLPLLRERPEDIPALVRYFIQRYSRDLGFAPKMPAPDVIPHLQQQPWPGNVRELSNVVRKALLLARGYPITLETIQDSLQPKSTRQHETGGALQSRIADLLARAKRGEIQNAEAVLTSEIERELYAQAISLAHGDQTKAAGWLGVSRPTMREKLIRYGLHPSQEGT